MLEGNSVDGFGLVPSEFYITVLKFIRLFIIVTVDKPPKLLQQLGYNAIVNEKLRSPRLSIGNVYDQYYSVTRYSIFYVA